MAERNHFSHWLMARTEFALAQKLRPRKSVGFRHPRRLAPQPHRLHRRISARTEPDPGRGLQSRQLSAGRIFLPAHRRRIAGRKGARTGLRSPPVASAPDGAALPRDSHRRAVHARPGHRRVRPLRRAITICWISPFIAATTKKSRRASWLRACRRSCSENLLAFLEKCTIPLAVRSSSLAGRLAIPALLGRVRDLHAGQPGCRPAGAARIS